MPDYQIHKEIQTNVHLIRGDNRSKFPEANSLLIDDEIVTLVDAGSSLTNIEQTLRDLKYSFDNIDRIVLTHFHIDHKGYAQQIWEKTNCEVLCHPAGQDAVKTFEGMMQYYGVQDHKYRKYWEKILLEWLPHVKSSYNITGYFQDRKEIDCGSISLLPIHTPGHTPDHTCIGINGTDTILLVDIDLTRFGPWYGNEVSIISEFKDSVQLIIDLEPNVGISSHLINPVEDNLIKRLQDFLESFEKREMKILKNIEQGLNTLDKLCKAPTIYPRIPLDLFLIFEEFMVSKHLEILKSKSMIREENEILMIERK
ncbi:MAG: MBL fold metallo-hydrolase [Candidatus Lokiarchaeota archaeon]|nr:MBL fold metallo-hydrolase [Candidatus Lokiarchaeota archaeon]